MTKKLMFAMMAATMVFATSCENDLDIASASKTSTVSFKIDAPEIASRAYSDGLSATVLQYAVYEGDKELTDLTVTNGEIHGSTTVNLQLVTGNTYSVIFWAANENAPYTVDFANQTMSVDYSAVASNNENYDAFYKYHTFTVNGAQTESIELKRPFAQINVGTNDYDEAKSAGYEPKYSAVTVNNIYNTLNLKDGAVSGEQSVTFGFNAVPQGETFPVDGYDYLAMNYVLVAAEKALVEVEFSYTEDQAANAKTRTVGSVPVQRNYRTNIYGQLFTSDVDVNVTIEPDYDEPANEADLLQLIAALGGTYEATENIDLTDETIPQLQIDNSMIMNMNGFEFAAGNATNYGIVAQGGSSVLNDINLKSAGGAIGVVNGAALTFNGGSVDVNTTSTSGRYLFYLEGAGSTLTINDGNFDFNRTQNQKRAYIYAGAGTTAYVNGGNFGKASTRSGYTAGILGEGTIIIKGGTFGFDPSAWVADGYKAVKQGETWYVVANDATVAATAPIAAIPVNILENNSKLLSCFVSNFAISSAASSKDIKPCLYLSIASSHFSTDVPALKNSFISFHPLEINPCSASTSSNIKDSSFTPEIPFSLEVSKILSSVKSDIVTTF